MRVPRFVSPESFKVKHTHASIVLGAYPPAKRFEKALEIGCGNAVSSIIMVLNGYVQRVMAVDFDETACESARIFVEMNDLSRRIKVIKAEVEELPKIVGYESCDFVFFNPPFHIEGKVSANERRFIERNKNVIDEFIKSSAKLLKNGGYFRFVVSPALLLKVFNVLENRKLTPKWLVPIYGKKERDSRLILIEGIKNGKRGGFSVKSPLFLDESLKN